MTKAILHLFVVLLVAVPLATPNHALAQADFNDARTGLMVYDFNIHKMDDAWRAWIKDVEGGDLPKPDLLLVQDMESVAERLAFQEELEDVWGGTWIGRGHARGWHVAVIWRDERFAGGKTRTWWGFGDPNRSDDNPRCVDRPDGTSKDVNNGAPAIQVRLFDEIAERYVSAVSFKSSPRSTTNCPWFNARKVDRKLHQQGWSGGLLLMGTDANERDLDPETREWRCWYAGISAGVGQEGCDGGANLGYADPIYDLCGGDKDCLLGDTHATHHNKAGTKQARIDYLFGRLRDGVPETSQQETMPWGNPKYSDHRAIRAFFAY